MPIENQARVAAADPSGGYWCSIEDSGYKYPPFPCAIRKVHDRFVLAKLGGSQRFAGEVRPTTGGFTFAGKFYCPYGDCTQALHGSFKSVANGALRGTFADARFIVRMVRAPDGAFGGYEYGGDEYGGFEYGGVEYDGGVDGAVLQP